MKKNMIVVAIISSTLLLFAFIPVLRAQTTKTPIWFGTTDNEADAVVAVLKTKINTPGGRFMFVPHEKAQVSIFIHCANIETPDGSKIMGLTCATMALTSDSETEPLYGVLMSVWSLGITATPEGAGESIFQALNKGITDVNLAKERTDVKNRAAKLFTRTHPQKAAQ